MSEQDPYRPRRGRYATVIPYIRGLSPRDELLRWWLLMEQHGGQRYIFWADQSGYESLRGDPMAFLDSFSGRLAFAVYDNASDELVGFNWIEHLKPKHHGQYGMYYKPKTPREVTREGTFLTCQAVFEYYTTLPAIFGYTPWKAALAHGRALGWQHVATIPGFAQMGDACTDIYVLKLDRP